MSIGHAWDPDMFEGPHALTTPIRPITDQPSYRREEPIMSSHSPFEPVAGPSTPEGREIVRAFVREAADDHAHDPWGSALMALGVLCDALRWTNSTDDVSEDIYRPSLAQAPWAEWIIADEFEAAWELTDYMRHGQVTVADIVAAVMYVDRFAGMAKAAGRDY